MRISIVGLMLVLLAGFFGACSQTPAPTTAAATMPGNSGILTAAGRSVLQLTLPPGAKSVATDGALTVSDVEGHLYFYVWVANQTHSVHATVAGVGDVIKGEFRDLKVTSTKDLTVAGSPAKQLAGTGSEADDGDPGHAEVVVFKVGDKVFVACIHGEGLPTARARDFMMTTLQTARLP
jgi:hypothetical protein